MFKSFRSRLIASYLLVILLAMGIAALLAWSALDRAFLDVLRENLLAQARRVAQTIESNETRSPTPPDAAPEPDQSGEAIIVGPAILTGSETPDLSPGIVAYTQATNPLPGYLTGSETLDLSPGIMTYSQASNALPGYHTRVIDDDGVVILGSPTFEEIATGETRLQTAREWEEWEPLSRASEIAGNLDISPIDTRGQPATLDLLDRPEIQRALAGEPATAVRASSPTSQRRIMYAAYPIRLPNTSPPAGETDGATSPPTGGTEGGASPPVGGA
ncbi:MAG: hypothetical protein GY842_14955, partial [bacterium]|nr:hypothetical protein [bacterium]